MSTSPYDTQFRQEVVDRLAQLEPQFPSTSAAAEAVAREFGISRETLYQYLRTDD